MRLRLVLLLSLCVLAVGCAGSRLSGSNHDADGPPWVAQDASSSPAPLEVEHRVVLIGDTGLFLEDDPTLVALERWTRQPLEASVVFLGDNLYDEGLQDYDRERGEKILRQQLEATAARKIFIPGNHDWGFSASGQTPAAILNQQEFIEAWPDGSAELTPRDGCIGPEARVLSERGRGVVLIALDPTAWIYPALVTDCAPDRELFLAELEALLAEHEGAWVVVGSHYPLQTGGPHGGLSYGPFTDFIVEWFRWRYGTLGDVHEPHYAAWIEGMQATLRRHPPVVYAGGHDHSLQVLRNDDLTGAEVVSGAGSVDRVSRVTDIPPTLFAHAHPGFVVLDFGSRQGEEAAVLRVVETGIPEPVFEMELR